MHCYLWNFWKRISKKIHVKYFAPYYVAKHKALKIGGRKAIDKIKNLQESKKTLSMRFNLIS